MKAVAELAASNEINIAELLGSQLDLLSKAVVVHRYAEGEDLVSKERPK